MTTKCPEGVIHSHRPQKMLPLVGFPLDKRQKAKQTYPDRFIVKIKCGCGKKTTKCPESPDLDPHSLCTSCRGKACSPSDTCPECDGWSEVQWVKFGTKKKKAMKRSPRKTSLSSPATSAGEGSCKGPSSSPTQSRGRGKSVKGKKLVPLSQGINVAGDSSMFMADQAPVSVFSGGPRDVALARGERVSVEDPMWNNNVPFSSPDSWMDVSGASAVEGAVGREDSPQEDPLAWGVPRTPLRSPLDMEEGLSESFPFMAHTSSLVPRTSAVPESFLQPSTSGVRRSPKKPPSGTQSRYTGKSDSSVQDWSGSSSEERRRRRRRKRDRSVRRNSPSLSPTGSKDRRGSSRSPPSKSRRPSSPQGTWVFVPDNKLRDLTKTSSLIAKQAGDSPPRRASNSLAMASANERRASSGRHKSRPRATQSAQRRESSPRTGSLDRSPHRDDRRGRAPPSNYFTEEPVPSSRYLRKKEPAGEEDRKNRGSRSSGDARDHASPQRRTEEVDDETKLPTEDSAYRRVISLIRGYNNLVEPVPQEEEVWTPGLNKFLAAPAEKKSSLALPEARDVGVVRIHIDKVIARNSDSNKSYSAAKLL
ncbi:PHD and RING finger domain-containing protein 1-like [Palaemon carinicauda]|uniref:PHD and RING finger domain-containing protein 1-like n=1 Tax=Palaemon carinicauda TaxID=392227 RepID=UPI0035B5912A